MAQGFPSQRVGVNVSAGTGVAVTGTVVFSNSNAISFGMQLSASSYVVTASVGAAVNALSAGTTLASTGTISFSNTNGVSFGLNGQTMTGSVGYTYPDYANQSYVQGFANITNLTALSERPFFIPFHLPYYLTWNRLVWEASRATSGSNSFSVTYGIYTISDSQTINLLGSWSNSYSGTNTASLSGIRQFIGTGMPVAVSALTPGMYVLGMHFHTLGGTASLNYSIRGASTDSPLGVVGPGADQASTATNQLTSVGFQFMGRFSTTTASLPSSIADSQLWHGLSGSQVFVPAWFRLGRT